MEHTCIRDGNVNNTAGSHSRVADANTPDSGEGFRTDQEVETIAMLSRKKSRRGRLKTVSVFLAYKRH